MNAKFNKKILVIDLPQPHGEITGLWCKGYPVHKGITEDSLNYATVYAHENKIIPDQQILRKEYNDFIVLLKKIGFDVSILPFPQELNEIENLHHDAIFIRDAGLMYKEYWIEANFSAKGREPEAQAHSRLIAKTFNKEVVRLPKDAYVEFGETFFLNTADGTYYFGGVSRSNEKGHNFVKNIVKPDHYTLLRSSGYHLDTVFTPLLSKENKLIGFILDKSTFTKQSLQELKAYNLEIIDIDAIDASGKDDWLGTYAVNAIIAPGVIASCAKFQTLGVEEILKELGIIHYVAPLTYFRYAGGSYHCLTNEILYF